MKTLTAQEISDILSAEIVAGSAQALMNGKVFTDTRKCQDQELFVALRGEQFNGDLFANAALQAGAGIAIVQEWSDGEISAEKAVIQVEDTLLALQKLATWWREQLEIPVIAITGSNGKTSTKDFIGSVLGQKHSVSMTQGNLNNHIGLPLTVLATEFGHDIAVWEMGMNHAGELEPLCNIGRPTCSVITNVGTAHIEFLETREAIAEEKATLARALSEDGILIIPASDDFAPYLREQCLGEVIAVGEPAGEFRAEHIEILASGSSFDLVAPDESRIHVELPVSGLHMVSNAMLAAAVGWHHGLSLEEISRGLNDVNLTSGRLRRFEAFGMTVFDDTYNANPESMAAAIRTLAATPVQAGGSRLIVLGRMGELGIHAEAAHTQVGLLAKEAQLKVIAVGEGAEGIALAADAPYFSEITAAAEWLQTELKANDMILFKGSRTAGIERVMNQVFPNQ